MVVTHELPPVCVVSHEVSVVGVLGLFCLPWAHHLHPRHYVSVHVSTFRFYDIVSGVYSSVIDCLPLRYKIHKM